MLDASPSPDFQTQAAAHTCDLCVIGAGIAGLNALFVASEYLPKGSKVVLIDKNEKPGGMWTTTYDYVRLHQPHPMFTTGDVKWNWSKPPEYLAARDEVQSHLSYCLDEVKKRVDLTVLGGHEYLNAHEYDAQEGARARVTCIRGNKEVVVDAARAIDAIGYNVQPNAPLTLSSDKVSSTGPELISSDGTLESDKEVVIVGGGKTAMDTVLALLRRDPQRKITLVSGKGTVFANRDTLLPTGISRWWKGVRVLSVFGDIGMHFDGDNEAETFAYGRSKYMIGPDAGGAHFLYGLLSEKECDAVKQGLHENFVEYLEDVTDSASGPHILFRSGKTHPISEGSCVINCSGHVLRNDGHRPGMMSSKGTILAITSADSIHFLTSVSAYFLTHLWYLGILAKTPFYRLDLDTLFRKDRQTWIAASSAQAFMNTVVMIQHAPFKVSDKCGLDFDRWYPLHRRIAGLIDIKRNHAKYTARCTRSLDRVRARYDLEGGIGL